jgi:hypothetical protein
VRKALRVFDLWPFGFANGVSGARVEDSAALRCEGGYKSYRTFSFWIEAQNCLRSLPTWVKGKVVPVRKPHYTITYKRRESKIPRIIATISRTQYLGIKWK